ncbi:hypothetical protein AB4865_12700 [Capnocytophaga sp. ARDL2]|uniref:hypothetical protein n=1 Tax=Capnocytophaga sp. ARDL2 TaxID=3238809 RepID=UPI003556D284
MTVEKAKFQLSQLNFKVIENDFEIPKDIILEVKKRFEEFKKHSEKTKSFSDFKSQILKERYGV